MEEMAKCDTGEPRLLLRMKAARLKCWIARSNCWRRRGGKHVGSGEDLAGGNFTERFIRHLLMQEKESVKDRRPNKPTTPCVQSSSETQCDGK